MTLFKNKYRIETTRLKSWNYSNNGYYFVTICTKNRDHLFGDIIDDKLILSESDGSHGIELWQFDGNSFPQMVLDINPGSDDSYPHDFYIFNEKLFFHAIEYQTCYQGHNSNRDVKAGRFRANRYRRLSC